ncbi:ankyrin repeat-containing domain protein [Flammula alnicola]|nr:ankyrin repeat-containing domain protein [Flammula alnicola]
MASNTPNNLLENCGLHSFALLGDDEGVRSALREGADINALDTAGRTVVMCAVAGEHWQNIDACDASFMSPKRINVLRTLLSHSDISLLTLNAPHPSMNGVIPLGMAAWLNQPQAVRTLLDASVDSVSVDGMDSHGATALMYAARDGNLEVVRALLSHGARPDFRDRNHRTSIQFALAHPRILWLCETVLRRHRWRESESADRTRLSADTEHLVDLAHSSMPFSEDLEPPPLSIFTQEATSRLTNTLVSSIRSSDLAFIHSLLFAPSVQASSPPALYPMSVPVLVNLPDSDGWSLVHHCVAAAQPSINILDALYCAGADVSLFTIHEKQTPLHILARFARSSFGNPDATHSLHDFCLHLIQDLRAPLSARDKDDETCIHIAAEHGESIDLLMLLLDCDTTGAVREMKNARGLTPLEVHFRSFKSHHSTTDSFASLSSFSELNTFFPDTPTTDASSLYSAADFDVDTRVQQLLSNLRATSLSIHHPSKSAHVQYLETCLEEATEQCNSIVKNADRIDSVRNVVALASNGKLILRGMSADDGIDYLSLSPRISEPQSENHTSTGTQTALLDLYVAHNSISRSNSAWLDRFVQSPESATARAHLSSLWDAERELTQSQRESGPPRDSSESPTKVTMKLKHVLKKKKRLEEKIEEFDWNLKPEKKDLLSGTSRVKAWLKRMVVTHHSPSKLELVLDLDEDCDVGHEIKSTKPPSTKCTDPLDGSINNALRTSKLVLEAAHRDLLSIGQCLEAAEQFIDMANHSISRTQRVVKRAIKAMIADLQTAAALESKSAANVEFSPGLLGYANAMSARPSLASISTIYSTSSSVSSVAATLTENDDEDIRVIRRLLLRKIEAQTSGAWDEVDKVMGWLQIVKEAVRSVKRRAYL